MTAPSLTAEQFGVLVELIGVHNMAEAERLRRESEVGGPSYGGESIGRYVHRIYERYRGGPCTAAEAVAELAELHRTTSDERLLLIAGFFLSRDAEDAVRFAERGDLGPLVMPDFDQGEPS